ncbi:hypothetical protein VNI00_014236 [Paramarasmius palmivorus]|uniref:Uncharacterized protein n=1 Tax=Paramarasmius palmivorus TaxID=297713 RepID=A0AAW0BUE2_9AGAR
MWYSWDDAIEKVQEVGKLPHNYFTTRPFRTGVPLPSSQLPQFGPIRYSQDTVCPQSDDLQDEDRGERPPMSADNVAERIDIQVHGSRDDTTGKLPDLIDSTLVPGSANPGSSGSQAPNKNDVLPPDNDESRTPRRTVAEATDPGDSEVQVTVSNNVAEGSSISPSAGDEPTVLRKTVPPDTDYNIFAQAAENGAQAISSSLERQGRPAVVDHGGQGMVDTEGTAADSGQDIHTASDNISSEILEHPDRRVAGIRLSRLGDGVGGDGVSGRAGWNPTNDPNSLRVHWFRP